MIDRLPESSWIASKGVVCKRRRKDVLRRYVIWSRKLLSVVAAIGIVLMALAACGGQTSGSGSGSGQSQTPIKIGVSVSLSGDFSADGQALQRGYQLWADAVNKRGGLLGRQVNLDILSDASSATQVVTNYQKLITVDKVDLVFGPFSSLLTKPASVVVNRYGYAFPEGAGGGPSVFTQGLGNIFDVALPVAKNLVSFTQYLLSLPQNMRPKTIAYATRDDPFTQPQVDYARQLLEQGGMKTASYQVYPAETTDYTPIATKVINSGAQVAILGTQFNDAIAFIQAFKQQRYNPQALIATGGPDRGSQFIQAVGSSSTEGIFVASAWYPDATTYQNSEMVKSYIAKYGGTAADISSSVGEAYAVGQVVEQAVTNIRSIDNAALIKELHSGTFKSVQGPAKFNGQGENIAVQAFLFQWQKQALIPVYPSTEAKGTPLFPKPQWA